MDSSDLTEVRRTLWAAADQLRANSTLVPNEYRGPVLGLIFLAYAEHRFEQVRAEVEAKATARRPVTPDDYQARSVLFVSEEARPSYLVRLPEQEDLGAISTSWWPSRVAALTTSAIQMAALGRWSHMAANGPPLACDLAEPPWRVTLRRVHRVLRRAADWNIATFTTEAVALA